MQACAAEGGKAGVACCNTLTVALPFPHCPGLQDPHHSLRVGNIHSHTSSCAWQPLLVVCRVNRRLSQSHSSAAARFSLQSCQEGLVCWFHTIPERVLRVQLQVTPTPAFPATSPEHTPRTAVTISFQLLAALTAAASSRSCCCFNDCTQLPTIRLPFCVMILSGWN